MPNTMNLKATSPLAEWLSYLENSHFKAIDLELERIKSVAEELDLLNPAPYVITVGGTNGKGTTCRLLETILLNQGLRVGVYSSPHLLRYNERVRIQNQDLPDEMHTASFDFIEKHKTKSLTYFEFSTLSALHLFKQAKLDVVILEVGLGGRLDATNIVDNDLAVITSIDIDHTDFLGSTREEISFEKAGIFRANKPVVIGEPNVPRPMLEQAEKLHCHVARRDVNWSFKANEQTWMWQSNKVRLENLENLIHNWQFIPNGTEGYRTAEVTMGGVDTHEISSKTMEATKIKGLYFIGEVLDVVGWLGGYNFQWAWSSAAVCAMGIAEG